jgi:hypothetical protein
MLIFLGPWVSTINQQISQFKVSVDWFLTGLSWPLITYYLLRRGSVLHLRVYADTLE